MSRVPLRDWLGKRVLGAANAALRRNRKFVGAVEKLACLAEFVRSEGIELVLSTGDYTTLGTEVEYALARAAVEPLLSAPRGFVHVPGNHDLYLPDAVRERRFERTFADTLASDLPEYRGSGAFPLVRLVGDDVAVVAVASARANPQPWRSSGRIADGELVAFRRILADPRVIGRFVFVLTHYAPRRADGTRDTHLHGLENADDFLAACRAIERGAILHGHIHHAFELELPELPIPIFNAGSTTYAGREGLWVFDVDATSAQVTRGRWDGARYVLDAASTHAIR